MKSNFQKCLKYVLAWEGGFSDHPKDPGGPTNKGITQKVYDAFRKMKKLDRQSVKLIRDEEVAAIYKQQYWDRVQGDALPTGLDYAVFDYAVNSGVARASTALQTVLGVKKDGIIGTATLAAIPEDQERVVVAICNQRFAFVKGLSTFSEFGKGWTRRIMGRKIGAAEGDIGVIDIGYAMAIHDELPPLPATDPKIDGSFAKADVKDTKLAAEPEAVAQASSGLSIGGLLSGDWIISGIQNLGELAGFTKDQLAPLAEYSPYIKGLFVACFIVSIAGAVGLKIKQRKEGVTV